MGAKRSILRACLAAMGAASSTGGILAPSVTGTLVASWDFNDTSKVTLNGSSITAVSGSDGTSFTLANAGTLTTCPTLVTRSGKSVARFTASNSQLLSILSNLGTQGTPVTIVAVFEHATTATTQVVFDLSNPLNALIYDRHVLLSSTTTGLNYRKADNSGISSNAAVGTSVPTGIQLVVARSTTGTVAGEINANGAGTAVVGSPTSGTPIGMGKTTVGNSTESNALAARYFDGWISRLLVYSTMLSDADAETVAVWASTNYGTTNGA